MDDLATGGSKDDIKRLKGNVNEKFETSGTLAQILNKGSLKLKVVVTSGEQEKQKVEKLGNSVLGLGWDPVSDVIEVDARGNQAHFPCNPSEPFKMCKGQRENVLAL